jgi:Zn-dependent protease/predicted transcriptional regulator
MLNKRVHIFNLLGFEVRVDLSWFFIALFITWSLATGLFPYFYPGLSNQTYWFMGIAGALGLFLGIIIHEFAHSLVARHYGLPMKGITLFIFGGVAEMEGEPPSPKVEFLMAIAGPVTSIIIALIFLGLASWVRQAQISLPVYGVLQYLGAINGLLAAFNLLPAFPLDGGRVLRSILWGVKKDLRWATRISSQIGYAFAIILIVSGFLQIVQGNFIGGLWWIVIGIFLQGAARMSYQQLLARQVLQGESVRRFMQADPTVVSPSLTIKQLVEDYIYTYHYKMFPVVADGKLQGCISTQQVKTIPRQEWASHTVGELANSCDRENRVSSDTDALQALEIMSRTNRSRLLVTEGDKLVGVLSLKDLLQFFSLKVELEQPSG